MGLVGDYLKWRRNRRVGDIVARTNLAADMIFTERAERPEVADVARHLKPGPPPRRGAQWNEIDGRWERWDEGEGGWVPLD